MKSKPIGSIDWYEAHGENNFAILCPFHEEETPSCIIMTKKGALYCAGCSISVHIEEDEALVTQDFL